MRDGETGFRLARVTAEEIADRIVRVISDDNLKQRMGQECRSRIESGWNIHLQVARMKKAILEAASSDGTLGRCVAQNARTPAVTP